MIVLQNISKYYYTDTSVTQALRKVNLTFRVGEFVAITGESGSGKSTLINVISGMDTFDDGEMYYNGEPTFAYDAADWEKFRREKIGFVFQNYSLIGHYTALQNITSTLLIMGKAGDSAEEKAKQYLKKVGLQGLEDQLASELSSGQKQRLSIARALAKETEIIVADEPTGNLDSETGKQIVELLKEVSKDRLVLMVTHNYEQAEPYVTRKVRLHDGEVVADTRALSADEEIVTEKEKLAQNTVQRDSRSKRQIWKEEFQVAGVFAALNRHSLKYRAWMFRLFLGVTALVSFIFIGQLFKNADDTFTRDYEHEIYKQKNDSRLSVMKKDGTVLTKKDIKIMQSIRNVTSVDQYDIVNDINYYCEENKDFHYDYEAQNSMYMTGGDVGVVSQLHSDKTPAFDKKNKFMRSVTCIDQSDLEAGRMPKALDEIVLYADEKKAISTKKEIYFTADNILGEKAYYHRKFKVVGILKKKTSQIYFAQDFCRMMSASVSGDQIKLKYFYVNEIGNYAGENTFNLVINEKLKGTEARVSQNYLVPAMEDFQGGQSVLPVERAVPGNDVMLLNLSKNATGTTKTMKQLAAASKELKEATLYDVKLMLESLEKKGKMQTIRVSSEAFNDQSGEFLEVSQEVFDQYCGRKSTQASVYIKNYTKTDKVISKLEKAGYRAVSTYRISSVTYNEEKVMDRLIFIGISVGILLMMAFVEVLILRSLMKIKIKDFYVLKSMGMQFPVIQKINILEMTRYCVEAMAVIVVVMLLLNILGISMVHGMMIYYGALAYLAFVLYNLLLIEITVYAFNRLLRGRIAV